MAWVKKKLHNFKGHTLVRVMHQTAREEEEGKSSCSILLENILNVNCNCIGGSSKGFDKKCAQKIWVFHQTCQALSLENPFFLPWRHGRWEISHSFSQGANLSANFCSPLSRLFVGERMTLISPIVIRWFCGREMCQSQDTQLIQFSKTKPYTSYKSTHTSLQNLREMVQITKERHFLFKIKQMNVHLVAKSKLGVWQNECTRDIHFINCPMKSNVSNVQWIWMSIHALSKGVKLS